MFAGEKQLRSHTKKKPLPLSWSQIKSMKTCRLKWYFDYIMRYRKMLMSTRAAIFGKSLHAYAEDGFYELKVIDGELDMFSDIDTEDEPIGS